jgi:hypothetical protein
MSVVLRTVSTFNHENVIKLHKKIVETHMFALGTVEIDNNSKIVPKSINIKGEFLLAQPKRMSTEESEQFIDSFVAATNRMRDIVVDVSFKYEYLIGGIDIYVFEYTYVGSM